MSQSIVPDILLTPYVLYDIVSSERIDKFDLAIGILEELVFFGCTSHVSIPGGTKLLIAMKLKVNGYIPTSNSKLLLIEGCGTQIQTYLNIAMILHDFHKKWYCLHCNGSSLNLISTTLLSRIMFMSISQSYHPISFLWNTLSWYCPLCLYQLFQWRKLEDLEGMVQACCFHFGHSCFFMQKFH